MLADLISLATRLIALVQAFDEVAANQEGLAVASEKFQDLLKVHDSMSCALPPDMTCIKAASWLCRHTCAELRMYACSFNEIP